MYSEAIVKRGHKDCFKYLAKNFFKEAISIKNHLFGCSWRLPWVYVWLILVLAVTLTHVEFKTSKLFCFTHYKFLPQRFQEKLLLWSSPCPEYDSFSGSPFNGNLKMFGSTVWRTTFKMGWGGYNQRCDQRCEQQQTTNNYPIIEPLQIFGLIWFFLWFDLEFGNYLWCWTLLYCELV